MANTFWPTSKVELHPSGIGLNSGFSTESTATSLSSSYPNSFAPYVFWSPWNVTLSSLAPLTTWKLVTTCPLSSQTNPVPAPTGVSVASREYRLCTSCLLVMNATDGVASRKSRTLSVSSASSLVGVPSGMFMSVGDASVGKRVSVAFGNAIANASPGAEVMSTDAERSAAVILCAASFGDAADGSSSSTRPSRSRKEARKMDTRARLSARRCHLGE